MNSYYKNAVTVFGLVLPLVVIGVLAGACLFGVARVNKKYSKAKAVYQQAQAQERQMSQMQKKVAQNGTHLKKWEEMMDRETRGSFAAHWEEAGKKFTSRDFQKAPHHWINQSEGLGQNIKQPTSQVEMKFTGTYRAMQLTLMEVESKLPQLQLDRLTVVPDNSSTKLNFTATFTVWTKK